MRALLLLLLLTGPALAQDQTVEDKLREALRRSTVDLRALQDNQAQLQADRDAATKQRDALQQQLDAANAKLAATPAAPEAKPVDKDELKKLSDMLDAARRDIATLTASNAKWQAAYREAAALAQAKDAEARKLAGELKAERSVTAADLDANRKLAGVGNDILHLYRTQGFRRILLGSYEPLLGLQKVELDNIVQDYEDRIYNLRLFQAKP